MNFFAMMLRLLLMIVIFGHCVIYSLASADGVKTLFGNKELARGKTLFLNADSESSFPEEHLRSRRDAPQPVLTNSTMKMKVGYCCLVRFT